MWFQSTRPVRGATSRDGFGSWDTMRFNPRAPCGARRPYESAAVIVSSFQSTRPVRGATTLRECRRNRILVSIHAPRAGRDFRKADFAWGISVSIHAPRAGRDAPDVHSWELGARFQSTRPVRGATHLGPGVVVLLRVSIHAPRAGRDLPRLLLAPHLLEVSIHAPRAGRDRTSTSRSATRTSFNPRAPCGARRRRGTATLRCPRFNPRAPCGARRTWTRP